MKRIFKLHGLLIPNPANFIERNFGPLQRRLLSQSHSRMTTSPIQITSPVFRSLFTPELQSLSDLFKERGYELRIAGGAVRDILMNITPEDIDLATPATPAQMKELFEEKQIRMLNSGGEKHGTVTARINDKENYEITTLRIDKTTDGRFAEVEFTKDWLVDANRRDLTINSMFLDLDGNLFDYFSGAEDVQNRVVRFVGEPDKRMQEDYLRILRYFRFYGRISNEADGHEPETLDAIRRNVEGLKRISGERLWTEFRKIVVGRFADSMIRSMVSSGLAPFLGLPEELNLVEMENVWKRCQEFDPKPMTIVASMLKTEDHVDQLNARLRLSNEEAKLAKFIIKHRSNPSLLDFGVDDADPLVPYKRLLADESVAFHPSTAKTKCIELLKYRGDSMLLRAMEEFEVPKFPTNGIRLLETNADALQGSNMGVVLTALRRVWTMSMFTKTEEELLSIDLPVILHNLAHIREAEGKKSYKKQKSGRN